LVRVTIHPEHPFHAAAPDRDPVRRLRGRLGGTVSLWTAGGGDRGGAEGRAGLTVSSRMVATGDPGHALALLDPDSSLAEALLRSRRCAMQLLGWQHRELADAFAGVTPAPGGVFRLARWAQTEWGPVLEGVSGWAGLRLVDREPLVVGWSILVDTVIEHVELHEETESPLVHRRGRYQRPPDR
jgi:flavin reductase (DIM6/NTAB) family NADH-FMN oxidoreductase RutF